MSCLPKHLSVLGELVAVKTSEEWGFPGGSVLKDPPVKEETQVRYLGWEDPLEEEMAPLLLPEKFQGQRSLVGYSPWGRKESDMTEVT